MIRDIETTLTTWKNDTDRRPLLIRGARQVGKSYTVSEFGQNEFENLVTINFEKKPQFEQCFDSLVPGEIIDKLGVMAKAEIVPGKSLLFLDEIQQCPAAITSLRYFYEEMPELHVIGAGSLLEFALAKSDFSMPVGRVQTLHMRPLSFAEFLLAMGEERARRRLETNLAEMPGAMHEHLLPLLRQYMLLGGMPGVLSEYLTSKNIRRALAVQTLIAQSFRNDFGKYAGQGKHRHLQKAFMQLPKLVGQKIIYSHIDPDAQSRNIKEAILLLEQAGVAIRVKKTSGDAPPLEAMANEGYYKAIFLDIGLMQNLCGLEEEIPFTQDLLTINRGALAEQFVGQELLAYQENHKTPALYYWARDARNSKAEVDYLYQIGSKIIPVEVKAGRTGTLKSMRMFIEKYNSPLGIRVSQNPYGYDQHVFSIPLYGISGLKNALNYRA